MTVRALVLVGIADVAAETGTIRIAQQSGISHLPLVVMKRRAARGRVREPQASMKFAAFMARTGSIETAPQSNSGRISSSLSWSAS
jgi:hypothetical protein